jgi:MFS family permease
VLGLLAPAFALGIAGFDPLGSAVLLAALGLGAKRRGVLTLAVCSVGTSLVLALASIFGLDALATTIGIHPPHIPHAVWLALAAAVGLGLLIWALFLLFRSPSGDEEPKAGAAKPRSASPGALAFSGLLVGLSSLADPAFWAMVVDASRWSRTSWRVIEALIWVICSHSLLIALTVAYFAVGGQRVEQLVEKVGYWSQSRHSARDRHRGRGARHPVPGRRRLRARHRKVAAQDLRTPLEPRAHSF